jgi:hypothetical protein
VPAETFESLDAVPEELRESAIETKAGTFVVVRDPDVAGLQSALQKEREARKSAEKAAKAAAEAARDAELKDKGLLEQKQKWDAEILKPVTERLSVLEQENRSLKLVTPVKDMLRKAGVIDPDDAWAVVGQKFDLADDGKVILKDNPTANLEQWVAADLKASKPHWFHGTQAGGGGATGGRAAPARVIASGDQRAFLSNLDAIAKGEVVVQ